MGIVFKIPAFLIYAHGGLWGYFLTVGIVIDHFGFVGGFIAFFLGPVALAFAPWYSAIADQNWSVVILVYGGGISAYILYMIGSLIDGD
jgi:hypothetical protein